MADGRRLMADARRLMPLIVPCRDERDSQPAGLTPALRLLEVRRHFLLALLAPQAPQLPSLGRGLFQTLDETGPHLHPAARHVDERDPARPRPTIELALDVPRHHGADDVVELLRQHDVVARMQPDFLLLRRVSLFPAL